MPYANASRVPGKSLVASEPIFIFGTSEQSLESAAVPDVQHRTRFPAFVYFLELQINR